MGSNRRTYAMRRTMRYLLAVMVAAVLATATVQAGEPGCDNDRSHDNRRPGVEWFQGRPVLTWIRGHEYHCLSSINSLGCGSLKSECTFMFGSCRDFYGEPCFKDPQPFRKHERAPIVGPYSYPYPYAYGPQAGCGCP